MADLTYAYTITQDDAIDAPESASLADSGLTGVGAAGLDPETLKLGARIYLVTIGEQTSAALAQACLTYAQDRGYGLQTAGIPVRVRANCMTPETVSALAAGEWSPT
jgi:hypothetical protein